MPLTPRCESRLQGVHPDLAKVVRLASNTCKFRVTEGLRSIDRQKELVASKKSQTMNSRHITGHAIDVIAIGDDGIATYDMDDLTRVANAMRAAAKECGVKIEWGAAAKYGGDFKTFNDSPHFQLPWREYPAQGVSTATKVAEAVAKPAVALPAAGTAGLALPSIPSPPDLSQVAAWKGVGVQISELGAWASANPGGLAAAVIVFVGVTFGLPMLKRSS